MLGAPTWILPHDADGLVSLARLADEWQSGTSLVVVTHASNVTGLVQPVAEIAALARSRGANVVVDAAQSAGIIVPIDVGGADAVAFSGHKGLAALPGTGALLVREGLDVAPLVSGGVGFDASSLEMPDEMPHRLEAGTPNLPGIIAMGCAAEAALRERWRYDETVALLREAVERAGARVVGRGELPVVSFTLDPFAPRDVEEMLDRVFGIRVRAGLHCAPLAHTTLETIHRGGCVRVSAGRTTSPAEIAMLEEALTNLRLAASTSPNEPVSP